MSVHVSPELVLTRAATPTLYLLNTTLYWEIIVSILVIPVAVVMYLTAMIKNHSIYQKKK